MKYLLIVAIYAGAGSATVSKPVPTLEMCLSSISAGIAQAYELHEYGFGDRSIDRLKVACKINMDQPRP